MIERVSPWALNGAIGKPPVLACGNVGSGGDYRHADLIARVSPYDSLQLLVNHDDQDREFVYG
jgi:hypothetical protein